MISGIHAMFYTKRADEMREFLREVLGLPWVDAGGGWPIFAAPPTDLAVHETEEEAGGHELYFICDDIQAIQKKLANRGIEMSPIEDRGWGLASQLQLPSGDTVGIYEPRHPRPHKARKRSVKRSAGKRSKAGKKRGRPASRAKTVRTKRKKRGKIKSRRR
jgi:catechol 2,3-dioxygenase-like lactoylglutathione lyase family enzyme